MNIQYRPALKWD